MTMKQSNSEMPAEVAELLDLGSVVGQNQAFGLVAGRCSSAQAASLRRLREDKKYKRVTPHWRDFCSRYLRMSGEQANQIIRLWEEFGAAYFEVAQLTRISPETYRAIAPAIREGALHCEGEVIGLNIENSRRIAAAVAQIRGAARPAKPARQLTVRERLDDLDKRCTALVAELAEISHQERRGENSLAFTAVLSRISSALGRLKAENGLP